MLRRILALLVLLVFLAPFLVGCGLTGGPAGDQKKPGEQQEQEKEEKGQQAEGDRYGGVYRYPIPADPQNLDPAHATDLVSNAVVAHIFNGLVKFNENLEVVGDIAKAWEASPDGLTWTFRLRKRVMFQDGNDIFPEGKGREVTSADFKYSFERVLAPETRAQRTWIFDRIKGAKDYLEGKADEVIGIKTPDRYTLVIELERPFSPFLSLMATANAYVVPREAVEEYGEDFNSHPIGTGPFEFVEWQHDVHVKTKRNEDYFEKDLPYLDEVIFRVIPEMENRLIEYETNNLEECDVPSSEFNRIINDPVLSQQRVFKPFLGTEYIGFNLNRWPFNIKEVRQAFNYAINREAINKVILRGRYILANGVLPPGMPGFDANLEGYPYDPQKAKDLLTRAGFEDSDGDGILEKDGRPLEFEYKIPSESTTSQRIAEAVQEDLAKIGARANIVTAEWAEFLDAIESGESEMYRLGWVAEYPDPDNFLFVPFHSSNVGPRGNVTFYKNEEVDKWLAAARSSTNQAERIELYQKAEKQIVEDAPWVFMFHYTQNILIKPYVKGRTITTMGAYVTPVTRVWLDKEEMRQ